MHSYKTVNVPSVQLKALHQLSFAAPKVLLSALLKRYLHYFSRRYFCSDWQAQHFTKAAFMISTSKSRPRGQRKRRTGGHNNSNRHRQPCQTIRAAARILTASRFQQVLPSLTRGRSRPAPGNSDSGSTTRPGPARSRPRVPQPRWGNGAPASPCWCCGPARLAADPASPARPGPARATGALGHGNAGPRSLQAQRLCCSRGGRAPAGPAGPGQGEGPAPAVPRGRRGPPAAILPRAPGAAPTHERGASAASAGPQARGSRESGARGQSARGERARTRDRGAGPGQRGGGGAGHGGGGALRDEPASSFSCGCSVRPLRDPLTALSS